MSATVKSVKITATAKPESAAKKERPWMKRNKSWKLTEIFWLNVKTYEPRHEMKESNHKPINTHMKVGNLASALQTIFHTLKRITSTSSTIHERPYTCRYTQILSYKHGKILVINTSQINFLSIEK